MAAPNSILSTTLQLLRDKLYDNSYKAHPLFRALDASGNIIRVNGGARVEQPVIFGEHSQISNIGETGFNPVNMAITDPFNSGKFEFANFTAPIVLSQVEKSANQGNLAVVNILENKVNNVMLMLKQQISRQVFRGGVSSLSPLSTLNGNGDSTTAIDTTGFFQNIAFGSQTGNTVGGLSKTTFASRNWQNQFFDATAGGGTFDLSDLDALMIQCQIFNPFGELPDLIFMSPGCYANFMDLQQSQVQYINATDRTSLDKDMVAMWRGAKIYVDPNLGYTSNAAALGGADTISAYVLNSKTMQLYIDNTGDFTMSDMIPVPGTATEAALVYCRMQLVTGHLASHGLLVNAG